MSLNVLLAGFEPFDRQVVNASIEVARRLDGWNVADAGRVHAIELPCVFGHSIKVLVQAIERFDPGLVIALGQARSPPRS